MSDRFYSERPIHGDPWGLSTEVTAYALYTCDMDVAAVALLLGATLVEIKPSEDDPQRLIFCLGTEIAERILDAVTNDEKLPCRSLQRNLKYLKREIITQRRKNDRKSKF